MRARENITNVIFKKVNTMRNRKSWKTTVWCFGVFYTAFEVNPKQTPSQNFAWNSLSAKNNLYSKQHSGFLMLRVYDFAFFLKFSNLLWNRFQRRRPFEDIAKRGFTCFTWNGKIVLPMIDLVLVVRRV